MHVHMFASLLQLLRALRLPRTSDTATHAHCCQILQSIPLPLPVLPAGTQYVTLLQEAAPAVCQAQMPKASTSASLTALISSNSQMKTKNMSALGEHARGSHTATQVLTEHGSAQILDTKLSQAM